MDLQTMRFPRDRFTAARPARNPSSSQLHVQSRQVATHRGCLLGERALVQCCAMWLDDRHIAGPSSRPLVALHPQSALLH